MAKINSKQKGARGERELSNILKEHGFDTRRTAQYSGIGASVNDNADVIGLPHIHIECKRVERLNISNAMQQAIDDSSEQNYPTVFHRKDREPWLVTMRLEDWIDLYKKYLENN